MCLTDTELITKIFQEIATGLSFVVVGGWVLYRFVLQRERYPNLNVSCATTFIGKQGTDWLVEITATIENKGKAQHKMSTFGFVLDGKIY